MKDYDKKDAVYQRNGENFAFDFYTSLSAKNKVEFVNFVTGSLIDDNYNHVLKDLIFDFGIICIFTDVDVSYILNGECDDTITAIEELISETNIVDIVKANADFGVIEELTESVDLNIEYKTGIHRNLIDESLSSLIKTLEKNIVNIDMNEIISVGQMLSGISSELTPAKILDAFAETDIYKNNHKIESENNEA